MGLLAMVGTVGTAVLAATPAGAPYQLTYVAPPGCPSEAAVRADIAAHVPTDTDTGAVAVRIAIALDAGVPAWNGELRATDRLGSEDRRSVTGRDCAEVAHALTFLAGIAIQLGGARAPPPIPPPSPPMAIAAEPPTAHRRFLATVQATGGILRGVAGSGGESEALGVTIADPRPYLMAAAASAAMVVVEGNVSQATDSVAMAAIGGRLTLCPFRLGPPHIELRGCGAGTLAVARATLPAGAVGTTTRTWADLEALVNVRVTVAPRVFVELEGGPTFALLRPTYTFTFIDGQQATYRAPLITGRITAGAGLRF